MNNTNKVLLICFLILLFVIIGEIFYLWSKGSKSSIQTKNLVENKVIPTNLVENKVTPTPFGKPGIKPEDLEFFKDPYYSQFLPLEYDAEKDRIYIKTRPRVFMSYIRNMGIDFASWVTLISVTKGQLVSLTMDTVFEGVISNVEYKQADNGGKYLKFDLTGRDNKSTTFIENEKLLKIMKMVKLVNGKEVPMSPEELKNGDTISIEGKSDMTKPPKDPNPSDTMKLIKH